MEEKVSSIIVVAQNPLGRGKVNGSRFHGSAEKEGRGGARMFWTPYAMDEISLEDVIATVRTDKPSLREGRRVRFASSV